MAGETAGAIGRPMARITRVDEQIWLKQFQGMFLNLVNITDAVLPGMRERSWGRILISSSAGVAHPTQCSGP